MKRKGVAAVNRILSLEERIAAVVRRELAGYDSGVMEPGTPTVSGERRVLLYAPDGTPLVRAIGYKP